MYQRLDECPVCKSTNLTNDRIITDYSISKESFALSQCNDCNFLFTNPRPSEEALGKYYESEDYVSHTDEGNNLINKVYRTVRGITLKQKLHLVNKEAEDIENLLDIGCGTGHFLETAAKGGWQIKGVEPNPGANEQAAKRLKRPIAKDLFDIEPRKQFQAITMWHVLEHLPKLNETVEFLKQLTTKKGRIFIAVPNAGSWDCQHYGDQWAAWDVPRHLYHFTQDTFRTLMKAHDLRVTQIHPMKFDAFYVSMLSEGFVTQNKNYIKAFKNGWRSNQWAKANNNNYSSLIYVVKKK